MRGWLVLAALAVLCSCAPKAPSSGPSIDRGRYLAEAVLQCFDCHSERDLHQPGWPPKAGRKGAGRVFAPGLVAPNLTPDRSTGAGAWTDQQFLRAIRQGIGHDGRTLSSAMGFAYYRNMTRSDVLSVVAYLRTLPAVHNPLPANHSASAPPPDPGTPPNPDLSTPADLGRYLVTIAGCESCHTPSGAHGPLSGMYLAGGVVLSHEGHSAASANLTPDASGLSYYNDGMFIEVMRTGKLGARPISPIMPWFCFRNMTDSDLLAMFAFLRTIPAVPHRVDNTEPPSYCRLCGARHGLGSANPPGPAASR